MALAILSVPKEKLRDEGGCEINTAHIYQMAKMTPGGRLNPMVPHYCFLWFYKKKNNNNSLAEFASYTHAGVGADGRQ